MSTINLTSLHISSSYSSPCLPPRYVSQNTLNISFYSRFKKSLTLVPSKSLQPYRKTKLRSLAVASALKNLTETEAIAFPSTAVEIHTQVPSDSGVYAIYDKNDELEFIGISRNIAASLFTHLKAVPELCGSVKVGVVDAPDRAALTQAWKSWMEEHIKVTGNVPPGNASGNATWVRKPQNKKPNLRLTPGRHVQLTVPLEELIDRLVKENKVVAFIKGSRIAPLCGFSQKVIGILESEGVDYESIDVLDEECNPGLRETLKKYSNWPTFPQVYANGELVGGCDILTSMHEKGELANVLKT